MPCASAISHTSCGKDVRSECPIPERTPEAMDGRTHPHPAERHVEGHDREWSSGLFSRKYELVTASRRHLRHDSLRRRDPTAAPDAPDRPSCVPAARSTPPSRSRSQTSGAPITSLVRAAARIRNSSPRAETADDAANLSIKSGSLPIGYCGMVAARQALPFRKELIQVSAPARRVLAGAQFLRAGPIEDSLDTPAHP